MIDQSGSMQELFYPSNLQPMDRPVTVEGKIYTHTGEGDTKAKEVAKAINRLLQNLVIKCSKGEGIRNYFHIGVLGYGAQTGPAFGGQLAGRDVVPISEIADTPLRLEELKKKESDGAGGLVEHTVKFPVWFDAVANGGTPMCQALTRAQSIVSGWLTQHPSGFPPIVINITDGESTDGDPASAAGGIQSLSSADGNVLLFNIHISSQRTDPIEFPDSETGLPDQYARLLYRMSSVLPESMRTAAQADGFRVSESTRGFAFNAKMEGLIQFLDIGTRVSPDLLR